MFSHVFELCGCNNAEELCHYSLYCYALKGSHTGREAQRRVAQCHVFKTRTHYWV